MKKLLVFLFIFLVPLEIFAQGTKINYNESPYLFKETQQSILTGYYIGTLKVNDSINLPIVLKFLDGKVFFSSPSQNANDLEISYVIEPDSKILIEGKAYGFSIKGTFDSEKIDGFFNQNGLNIKIILSKTDNYPTQILEKRQTPKTFNYSNKEVTISNKSNNRNYFGTFTTPNKIKNQSAVLFITGSGIQNRDEQIFNHKPFLVISDYLTKMGYYTLRCDDYGYNGEDITTQTTLDTINDIKAQIEFLKNNKDIERIILLGHSEGGIVAQALANEVDSIILLSSPAISGSETYKSQVLHLLKLNNISQEIIKYYDDKIDEVTEVLTNPLMSETNKKEIVIPYLKSLGNDENSAQLVYDTLSSPWYVTFLRIDPRDYIKNIKVPVLILQGLNDTQVDSDINIKVFEKLLKSKNKIITYPKYNHLLQKSVTGEINEYKEIETTIEENVLSDILEFLDSIN